MADYGMKTSKKGENAITATGSDIIMTTRHPFAKIDPTKLDTFRTTTVTFITDIPDNVKTEVARFQHGYSYRPQAWGLWNATWGPDIPGTGGAERNGYGVLFNSTSPNGVTISYGWDETNVYLYMYKGVVAPSPTYSVVGTIMTLSSYIFVDDLQEASYA